MAYRWKMNKRQAEAFVKALAPKYADVLKAIERHVTTKERGNPVLLRKSLEAFDKVFTDLAEYALTKFVCSQCGSESDEQTAQCRTCNASMDTASQPSIGMGVATPLEPDTVTDPAALAHELDDTKRGAKPPVDPGFNLQAERARAKMAKARRIRLQ